MKNSNVLGRSVWRSILAILVGLIMIFMPGLTILYIVILIGIMLLLSGITSLVTYYSSRKNDSGDIVRAMSYDGIVSLVFGLAIVIFPSFFVEILMIVLGVVLLIAAIGQFTVLSAANRRVRIPFVNYLSPILIFISGVIILFNPFATAAGVFIFFGAIAVFYGITELLNQRHIASKKAEI